MNFNKQVEANIDDMIAATRELISIKSVQGEPEGGMPYGKGMAEALDYVLNLAAGMGFVTKNIDGYCGYAEYGEGDTYIGIVSHVDVNNEEDVEWKFDPYNATVVKDRIYGCFAVDKGAAIASIYALKIVKESSKKLNRKVRLIFGTDSTRRYDDIAVYLKNEAPPIAGFATEGHFPVTYTEKGLGVFSYVKELPVESDEYIEYLSGGKIETFVPGNCVAKLVTKRRKEILGMIEEYAEVNRKDINAKLAEDGLEVEVTGRERHSAAIEKGINSISIMMDFLRYIKFGSGKQKELINFICDRIGFDLYGENLGISHEDVFSGKTTVNLGIVQIKDETVKIGLDCRYAATSNYYHAVETTNRIFTEQGFEIVGCDYWPPTYFPENHFLVKVLLESYREITRDDSNPVSSCSASYSKAIPNIVSFGAHFPGEVIMWGQTNEFLEITALKKTAQIYANAILKLCSEV